MSDGVMRELGRMVVGRPVPGSRTSLNGFLILGGNSSLYVLRLRKIIGSYVPRE